jgi:hypothetical protein
MTASTAFCMRSTGSGRCTLDPGRENLVGFVIQGESGGGRLRYVRSCREKGGPGGLNRVGRSPSRRISHCDCQARSAA